MSSAIKELWNGEINPREQCGVGMKEIEQLIVLIERNEAQLASCLTKDLKEVFEKYISCMDEYSYLISEQAFCEGFCLAGKLWSEMIRD